MSTQITTAFVKQYHANVDILNQQKGSRLRPYVRVETVKGEKAFFDQISQTTARKRTTRHGDTPLIDTPHSRRMVVLSDFDWADLIDDLDKVKLLADPTSQYARNAAFAMGRAMDEEIITAAFGTAYTGADGGTSTSFDSTNNQIASASTNLTIAKILTAKEILDANDIDEDIPRYIACTADQITGLLNTTEIKSTDYNTVKALANGQIDTFAGFKFVRSQRLGVNGSSYRRCIAWAETSLLLAIGQDTKARITERDDKNYATQVYNSMSIGATRMDEDGVVEILCEE